MNNTITKGALRLCARASEPIARPSHLLQQRIPQRAFHRSSLCTTTTTLPSRNLIQPHLQLRHDSSSTSRPLTNRPDTAPPPEPKADPPPSYDLSFTCKSCTHRSTHRISKQGYHHGTILITCPGCKNRHLISDHLKIFSDTGVTIEDILKERGQSVRRGSLEGDVEIWDDGTTRTRGEGGEK